MRISCTTRISDIIKADIRAIEAIAEINPHFRKLKNPILRKLLAPRVTVAEAATIGKVPVSALLDKLKSLNFIIEESVGVQESSADLPDARQAVADYVLDVRPALAEGKDPLKLIMQKVKELPDGKTLLLVNNFEPVPLIHILVKKGYTCQVEQSGVDLVNTYIRKNEDRRIEELTEELYSDGFEQVLAHYVGKVKEVDVRGLEMPGPMVTILSELEILPADVALYIFHKKVPHFLLPELEERGWKYFIRENDEHDVRLLICKP